ncbi:hypothetical protein GQR58_023330 [Nymphon striatum]|nr:hypothetical protein GQR58_023330 [Nymphon striatum]
MQENHLAKWLNNELSEAELSEFKNSDTYASYERIANATNSLEGPDFDSEEALLAFKNKRELQNTKVIQLNPFKKFLRVAAAIAILLTGSYFFLNASNETVTTQYAENKEVILPDNSEVTLNADSELSFNKKDWATNRNLALEGEAFFKVAKGERFTVNTAGGTVAVLGTQFNVENRNGFFEVTCYEGLVSVTFNGNKTKLPAGSSFVAINGETISNEKPTTNVPSWMNAESSFKIGNAQEDSPSTSFLIPFIQELEKSFEIKFSYADADIDHIKITAPESDVLAEIINSIQIQTKLRIQKLNERYYTITPSSTLDICGIVLDNFEQNTVAGATVQILGSEKAVITELDGSFKLSNVPRGANLRIKHIGFQTLFTDIEDLTQNNPCKVILLSQYYQQLEEVVVYDFLTKEPDVLQTVQALPGVKSIDETVSDINIRGGSNDQNLIIWDGIKMYQSGHFFGLISAFNPHLTDKVTLIKNGTSAQYGDGVSGIINMRTKNELTDEYYGGAGFNLISGDLFGQVPLNDKVAIQFSAQVEDVERDDKFYFYDFTGKVLYDINTDQKLRFSFININNFLDYSERSVISLEESMPETLAPDAQQVFFQQNLVVENGIRLNTNYNLSNSLNWLNGYQLNETSITNATNVNQPPFQSNVTDIVKTHAFYSELGYKSTDEKLRLNGGVRLNYYDNPNTFTEFVIEPRVNLSYAFTREFKATLLGEFKSQATNQFLDLEQNFLGVEKRRWILSNGEDLPIVKSKQASFGFNYDAKNLYVGIEGFFKEVNGISTITQGLQNQNQFRDEQKIGKYDVRGIEFLINQKTDTYSIWASYAYNYNTYNFPKPDIDNPIDDSIFPSRINYQEINSSRLTDYLRADASVIYDFNISSTIKASTGVSVLNFTDRANILNRYYRIDGANGIETVESFSLGISPNFTFRLKF